jgi:hypothetical protein
MHCRGAQKQAELHAVRNAPVIFTPGKFIGVAVQMTPNDSLVDPALARAHTRIETLGPVRVNAFVPEFFGVVDVFEIREVSAELQPMAASVRSHRRRLGDAR